jgi:secernin
MKMSKTKQLLTVIVAILLVTMAAGAVSACNIAIAMGNATANGNILIAKNSNRGNEECQRFVSFPHQKNPAGSKEKCTWIEIPRASETYAVRGGQPYWGFGFEQGMNEYGVSIGNVASYYKTVVPKPSKEELTGLDLLRLALERSKTASEAVQVIIELNQKYGQFGWTHPDHAGAYCNSFAIGDPNEVWILELPGRDYIAQKLPKNGVFCLDNVPFIRTSYDIISPGLIKYATKQGWYKEGRAFDFSYYFMQAGDRKSSQVYSEIKYMRVLGLLKENYGKIDPAYLMQVLRDRREGDWAEERFMPYRHYRLIDEIQPDSSTAGTMVADLRKGLPNSIANVYWMAMSSTNTTAFTPVYWGGEVPAEYAIGNNVFDKTSPWWTMDLLDRMSRKNYYTFTNVIRSVWKPVEEENFKEAEMLEKQVIQLEAEGKKTDAVKVLTNFHKSQLNHQVSVAKTLFYSLQVLYKGLPGGYPPAYDDSLSDINAGVEDMFTVDLFK